MKNEFIPGIFNYCDKWCSRCEFKKRCSVYVDDNRGTNDLPNEALIMMITDKLKALSEILEHSSQLVSQTSEVVRKEFAFAGNNEMEKPSYVEVKNSLMAKANEYEWHTASWLAERKVDESIRIFGEKLDLQLLTADEVALELATLQEWLDEIEHFMTFIPAKIKRAIASARRQNQMDFGNGFPRDSDGSAKIAILAIKQSIEIWERLMAHFPELEDDCLDFLARLQQLKDLALKEFPNAMNFIRPGFDEIHC
jgi:hypothetical protein